MKRPRRFVERSCADYLVQGASGAGKTTLLDNVLGNDFALLCFCHKPDEAFASLNADTWQRLCTRFVSIENEIEGFPLNLRDFFILVRPDRYIYGVFKAENANAFASTFQDHFLDLIHTQQ